MKSLKLFSILFIAPFIFSACGDDDEESIVGTWEYLYIEDAWALTSVYGLSLAIISDESRNNEIPHTYTFGEDNTYQMTQDNMTKETGIYTYKGGIVTLIPNNSEHTAFKFALEKNNALKTVDLLDKYVTLTIEGDTIINVSKIQEIMERHPEETAALDTMDISTIEIDYVLAASSYKRK